MRETDQGVVGTWLYNRDLFEARSMARMISNFQRLLESIIADPAARIDGLEMLSEMEKEQRREEKRDRQESQIRKLRSIKRRAVHLS